MERTSLSFRRHSSRPLSAQSADLLVAINQFKEMRKAVRQFSDAQQAAFGALLKWGNAEESRERQDVCLQYGELNLLWNEVQQQFADRLRCFTQVLEQICDSEKYVDVARHVVAQRQAAEAKLKKELKRLYKRLSPDERKAFEARVSQAEASRELAEADLAEQTRHFDRCKAVLLRKALLCLSDAYCELGDKCSLVHNSMYCIGQQLSMGSTQASPPSPVTLRESPSLYARPSGTQPCSRYRAAQFTRQVVLDTRQQVRDYTGRFGLGGMELEAPAGDHHLLPNAIHGRLGPIRLTDAPLTGDDIERVRLAYRLQQQRQTAVATRNGAARDRVHMMSRPCDTALSLDGMDLSAAYVAYRACYEAPPPYCETSDEYATAAAGGRAAQPVGDSQCTSASDSPASTLAVGSGWRAACADEQSLCEAVARLAACASREGAPSASYAAATQFGAGSASSIDELPARPADDTPPPAPPAQSPSCDFMP